MNKLTGFLLALFHLFAINSVAQQKYTPLSQLNEAEYVPQTIILKVKNEYRSGCHADNIDLQPVHAVLQPLQVTNLKKLFPHHQPPVEVYNEFGLKYADLSLIYEIKYSAPYDLQKVLFALFQTGMLEYAEPRFLPAVNYTPNDPQISMQSFLQRINAYDGWDVSRGDTNTVIGITDTGTDLDHPDLAGNIKYNYADPINGADDDNDGYIDNFHGWDVGENDNDPTVGFCGICSHGSHVSGCAAAITDNNIGVASPGFYCKYLPIKVANASGALTAAYEGIVYAADHGCQIINCSWGGGGGGMFGQNIIDYATINKNSLVIAAAGNNGSNQLFYPAAYQYVFCIAATNSTNDVKASFSNYGIFVDACAPGNNIFSTVNDDSYISMSGTSMAAPIASGVAAVVKSHFPSYNALQVAEQVRITAENIYNLPGNSPYMDDLGSGRINMLNALTLTGPSVRMNPIHVTDLNDDIFVVGDTLYISGIMTNYLDPTVNLSVMLSTASSYVTIIDNLTVVGAIGTMATASNSSDPFIVRINPGTPQNALIPFKLSFQDGSYLDFQVFNETVNVDYINLTVNDVWTTNTSKGRICYNGNNQTEGLGFDFLSNGTIAYETGFMAGTSIAVSDNIRSLGAAIDNDWMAVNVIQKATPGIHSDLDAFGSFNDAFSPFPLGLGVNHSSYSWSSPPHHRYHIFEYIIYNNSLSAISNLYAGIFSDWDIQDYNHNKAGEDVASRMGYAWNTDSGGYYAGIKLLTPTPFIHYAIDNITGGSGGLDLSNGFSENEKFLSLSTSRPAAGGPGAGNDVIDVVSSGPFSLQPGDSVTVAFALIAGTSLSDILESATFAQAHYDPFVTVPETVYDPVIMMHPNPAKDKINIYSSALNEQAVVELYDMEGRLITSIINSERGYANLAISGIQDGFYMLTIKNDHGAIMKKIVVAGN